MSICFYKKTETRVRLTQAISTFGCLIFFCILANVRDCFSLTSNQSSIFESGLYEHGAGGSLGAVLYSGMPFTESAKSTFTDPGLLRVWLGNVGTSILAVAGLIFGLCFHIRLYFNFVNPLTKLSEFSAKLLTFKKANNAEVSNEQTEKPSKSDSKKWKIDFFGSKNEDDLFKNSLRCDFFLLSFS